MTGTCCPRRPSSPASRKSIRAGYPAGSTMWNCGWSRTAAKRPAKAPPSTSPAAGRIPAGGGATARSQGSSAGCWPAPEAPARAAPRPVPWSITCCTPVRWPGPPCSGSARGIRRVCRWTGRPVTASARTPMSIPPATPGAAWTCRACTAIVPARWWPTMRAVGWSSASASWQTTAAPHAGRPAAAGRTRRPSRSRIVSGTVILPACAWPAVRASPAGPASMSLTGAGRRCSASTMSTGAFPPMTAPAPATRAIGGNAGST